MRADKFLTCAGVASRKEAGRRIRAGRVAADGKTIADPGADVAGKTVTLDGIEIESGENVILAMNKPAGYVSATEDAKDKTVSALLPSPYSEMRLSIVGRLDKDTEGLILFASDGAFVHEITSPKKKIPKVYYLEADTEITAQDADALRAGVSIGEGQPVHGILVPLGGNRAELEITEGKFHQVKRMLFALGKTVTYLRRDRIGKLKTANLNLAPGEVRRVKREEIL